MKKFLKIVAIGLMFFVVSTVQAQNGDWQIKKGEKLTFKIAFSSGLTGDVKGGQGVMTVKPNTVRIGDNTAYHAVLTGGTVGIIELFYQVDNKYESFIDSKTKAPLLYTQNVRENKYRNNDTVYFDQNKKIATYNDKKMAIPENTQDFLSVFYLVRGLDMAKLKKGDTFTIPFFTQDKVVNSHIIFNGIEKVKTKRGVVECYAFMPQVGKGKVFNQDYPATMWISTDSARLPVLVEARMKVGKMKMELIKVE